MLCRRRARLDAVAERLPTASAVDLGSVSKERLLTKLSDDVSLYKDTDVFTRLALLTQRVEKHPYDDCSKFLAERNTILASAEHARTARESVEADLQTMSLIKGLDQATQAMEDALLQAENADSRAQYNNAQQLHPQQLQQFLQHQRTSRPAVTTTLLAICAWAHRALQSTRRRRLRPPEDDA